MHDLIEPRDQIFVKCYEFLSLAKNKDKDLGKNISRKLSSIYSQNLVDHEKQSAIDVIKNALKRSNSDSNSRCN